MFTSGTHDDGEHVVAKRWLQLRHLLMKNWLHTTYNYHQLELTWEELLLFRAGEMELIRLRFGYLLLISWCLITALFYLFCRVLFMVLLKCWWVFTLDKTSSLSKDVKGLQLQTKPTEIGSNIVSTFNSVVS